ncbi:MAG TPA: leucyl aminopeptidase [Gaiellaceae bacterium]|nr:leucyl aminopeptidase [Gaiellaceae bacterium]
MEIDVVEAPPGGVEADVLVFPVPEPAALPAGAQQLDRLLEGGLTRLVEDGELRGETGRVTLLHTDGRLAARRVAAAGVGGERVDADRLRTAAGAAATRAADIGARAIAWLVDPDGSLPTAEQARAVVDGVVLGPYEPGRWKTEDERRPPIERLVLCGPGVAALAEDARRAAAVASWANRCRDLVNAPGNEMTPERLASWAEELAAASDALRFEALGPEEIRAAGMGALEAVARGSHNAPRLITLAYEPDSPARADVRVGLVGKAITFDSGGLSLKPSLRMEEMKSDMGGGAAVLAAMGAVAELELPVRLLAVVPACENMPGGHATRPGDIVTALNGKTIEIANTDAEGRLILADALWFARESGATHLLDLATLTGGIVVAMGDLYAGLFGNDDAWTAEIEAAASASGDRAWRLPLHERYGRYNDSPFADLKNSSDYKQASPILAAAFLAEFAGEGPWAHLDIAGTAYLERGRGDYYTDLGATGYGVRLLAELARRLAAP